MASIQTQLFGKSDLVGTLSDPSVTMLERLGKVPLTLKALGLKDVTAYAGSPTRLHLWEGKPGKDGYTADDGGHSLLGLGYVECSPKGPYKWTITAKGTKALASHKAAKAKAKAELEAKALDQASSAS